MINHKNHLTNLTKYKKGTVRHDCIELDFMNSLLMGLNCDDFKEGKFKEQKLLELIHFHRVENLFYSKIKGENFISSEFELKLKQICISNQIQKLDLVELFFSIVHELNQADIPVLAFKGPILSFKLYHDFTKRTYRDCDFKIHIEHIDSVIEIFKKKGFHLIDSTMNTPKQKEYFFKVKNHISFVNANDTIFEVHVDISPFLQNKNLFQESKQWKEVKFGKAFLYVLDDVDEFIYLCLHGSRNLFYRFSWILDVHNYLIQQDAPFIQRVFERAKKYNCTNFIEETLNMLHYYSNEDYQETTFLQLVKSHNISQIKQLEKGQKIRWQNKVFVYYSLIYAFFGLRGSIYEFKMRRIKPQNWNIYVFKDSIFVMNQFFSELIWLFSKFKKNNG